MNQKLIIVTGGAGFVGSHLCARLVRDGHRVISLDNYFTGSEERHCPGVEYRRGHTRDIATCIPENPDLVFHLGEYSRVEKSFEDPIELIWDLNIAGTFSVLEFCRKKNCKLVYAGSSTKFADGGLGKGQSPYAWSKASNTELVQNYGEWFDLKFAITYFYNVYGQGEIAMGPYATVIGIFKQLYARGLPLTVVSPGTQARCFTHISDIVDGLVLVGEKGQGDGYGIGNPRPYSIFETAKLFSDNILMMPERKGNRQQGKVEESRMGELGWKPQVSLESHIAEYKASIQAQEKIEKRILVFTTTFYPIEGPAERALVKVIREMPDVHFDIITTLTKRETKDTVASLENVTVYRMGKGDAWDKYRLLFEGSRKAKELMSQHRYIFTWAIMASYAAMSAVLARRASDIPLLIALADHRIDQIRPWLRWLLRLILKNADQISASNGDQEKGISRLGPAIQSVAQNKSGDAFANQVRFLYNMTLKKMLNEGI